MFGAVLGRPIKLMIYACPPPNFPLSPQLSEMINVPRKAPLELMDLARFENEKKHTNFTWLSICRVRTEMNGGAWCPATQATPDTKEFIEIDLKTVHMITGTETQGRFGNGQGVEFAEAYMLEYYRLEWGRMRMFEYYRSNQT